MLIDCCSRQQSIIDMQAQPQYIVQCRQSFVKLKKSYLKIFNLLPAAANTYVFLGLVRVGCFVLVNADQTGNILFEHKFEKAVDGITLLSDSQVLALQPRLNQLLLLHLSSHQIWQIPFQFLNEQPDQSTIFTFRHSQYLCVLEKGRHNDSRLKLSYFQTPLAKDSLPFAVYESNEEWNCQYLLKKGNEHSMILWYRCRNDTEIQLKVHQIKAEKSQFVVHKIKNQIGLPYGEKGPLQLAILNVWQLQADRFLLACNTQKTALGFKNKEGVINNNFVFDTSLGKLSQAAFWFNQKYNDFLIDIQNYGQFSVFRTYSFKNGKAEETPCYYIHNTSEKIVANDSWQCSYKVKFEYPMNESVIVEGQYENANVSEFKLRVKKVVKVSK